MSIVKLLNPGATIGILGGGQLGRMTALAAAGLGYKTRIYCQQPDEPAAQVTSQVSLGSFDDHAALRKFAAGADVVTLEWENIPTAAIEAIGAVRPVHPGAKVLEVAQDRVREKAFARSISLGTADFAAVNGVEDLAAAMRQCNGPAILKTNRLGYDGRGQRRVRPDDDPAGLWQELGGVPAILEAEVPFAYEISVIVARRADKVSAAFPPVRNRHENGILAETTVANDIPPAIAAEAVTAATRLADSLGVIGLLTVEMFVLPAPNAARQNVLINEIAPRPHNSGHWTIDGCATSQFEQLVRAICGLPLGATAPRGKSVTMHNLIGPDPAMNWLRWLAEPDVHLHFYGKAEARPGRKMGHVTVIKN